MFDFEPSASFYPFLVILVFIQLFVILFYCFTDFGNPNIQTNNNNINNNTISDLINTQIEASDNQDNTPTIIVIEDIYINPSTPIPVCSNPIHTFIRTHNLDTNSIINMGISSSSSSNTKNSNNNNSNSNNDSSNGSNSNTTQSTSIDTNPHYKTISSNLITNQKTVKFANPKNLNSIERMETYIVSTNPTLAKSVSSHAVNHNLKAMHPIKDGKQLPVDVIDIMNDTINGYNWSDSESDSDTDSSSSSGGGGGRLELYDNSLTARQVADAHHNVHSHNNIKSG